MTRVILATFDHRYGTDTRIFHDDAAAENWRQKIAEECWNETGLGDMPEDASEATDRYFNHMESREEHFGTESIEVEGGLADPIRDTMLAALQSAEHWLTEERDNPGQATPGEILRVISAAIATAEGRA